MTETLYKHTPPPHSYQDWWQGLPRFDQDHLNLIFRDRRLDQLNSVLTQSSEQTTTNFLRHALTVLALGDEHQRQSITGHLSLLTRPDRNYPNIHNGTQVFLADHTSEFNHLNINTVHTVLDRRVHHIPHHKLPTQELPHPHNRLLYWLIGAFRSDLPLDQRLINFSCINYLDLQNQPFSELNLIKKDLIDMLYSQPIQNGTPISLNHIPPQTPNLSSADLLIVGVPDGEEPLVISGTHTDPPIHITSSDLPSPPLNIFSPENTPALNLFTQRNDLGSNDQDKTSTKNQPSSNSNDRNNSEPDQQWFRFCLSQNARAYIDSTRRSVRVSDTHIKTIITHEDGEETAKYRYTELETLIELSFPPGQNQAIITFVPELNEDLPTQEITLDIDHWQQVQPRSLTLKIRTTIAKYDIIQRLLGLHAAFQKDEILLWNNPNVDSMIQRFGQSLNDQI